MNPANNTPDINFIPQEIVERRHAVIARSANNRFAVGLVFVVAVISGAAFYFNNSVQRQLTDLEAQISINQGKIDGLQEFGKHGYKLGLRLQNAKTIINERGNYSYLMDEIKTRMPDSIQIESIEVTKSNEMIFNGITRFGYPVIADFQNSLLENNATGKNLFSDVKLKSSNFNKTAGDIAFTLEITLSDEIKKAQQ